VTLEPEVRDASGVLEVFGERVWSLELVDSQGRARCRRARCGLSNPAEGLERGVIGAANG
jgi:hypothetical protein